MTLHTDKDLKSKKGVKSLYISQGYRFKKKILNQSQQNFGLKKAYFFWVTLIQAVLSKRLDSFTKYFSVYKVLVP